MRVNTFNGVPSGAAGKRATSNRVAALDLLRGLAAWAVAISHFFSYNAIRQDTFEAISIMAVEIFFVLSGFVLAEQILLCVATAKPRLYLIFLIRRWMRTLPPYIVALAVVSVLFRQLGSADFFRYLGYLQNLLRQSNHQDYYSIAWSLSIEEWFYMVFPGLMIAGTLLIRRNDTKFVVSLTLVFIGIVTAGRTLQAISTTGGQTFEGSWSSVSTRLRMDFYCIFSPNAFSRVIS